MGDIKPYLIIGHGIEDVSDASRKPLPAGVTLVTLTKCGNSTRFEEVCPFIKLFQDEANADMLKDPVSHKAAIEARTGIKLRITRPGQPYPFYVIQYLAAMVAPPGSAHVVKSGIYPFPITSAMDVAAKWKQPPAAGSTDHCDTFYLQGESPDKPTAEILREVYRGSVYPPLSEQDISGLTKHTYKDVGKLLTEPFDDAIALLPKPAVYYYVICRAPYFQSPGNVFRQTKQHMYSTEKTPGSIDIKELSKALGLNYTDKNIADGNAEEIFLVGGVKELVAFSKNSARRAAEPKVSALLDSIKPLKTRNAVEQYNDLIPKLELLKKFDTSSGITDPKLKKAIEAFRNDFIKNYWYVPKINSAVRNAIMRRRADSNARQDLEENNIPNEPAAAGGGQGGGRRAKTKKTKRVRRRSQKVDRR